MNRTVATIVSNSKRHALVFAAMLFVLLTSCAVKGSIKSLAGIPVGTERSVPKSNQHVSSNTVEKCADAELADTQIVQQFSFQANNLLPVLLLTTVFLFQFGFRPVTKENKHPVYSGSSKIRSTIPIFLEYRKLILHFAH